MLAGSTATGIRTPVSGLRARRPDRWTITARRYSSGRRASRTPTAPQGLPRFQRGCHTTWLSFCGSGATRTPTGSQTRTCFRDRLLIQPGRFPGLVIRGAHRAANRPNGWEGALSGWATAAFVRAICDNDPDDDALQLSKCSAPNGPEGVELRPWALTLRKRDCVGERPKRPTTCADRAYRYCRFPAGTRARRRSTGLSPGASSRRAIRVPCRPIVEIPGPLSTAFSHV